MWNLDFKVKKCCGLDDVSELWSSNADVQNWRIFNHEKKKIAPRESRLKKCMLGFILMSWTSNFFCPKQNLEELCIPISNEPGNPNDCSNNIERMRDLVFFFKTKRDLDYMVWFRIMTSSKKIVESKTKSFWGWPKTSIGYSQKFAGLEKFVDFWWKWTLLIVSLLNSFNDDVQWLIRCSKRMRCVCVG